MKIPIEVLRNLVLRYGAKAGIKRDHILLIWHLLDHAFNGQPDVFPGLITIAKRMGVKVKNTENGRTNATKTVRRWLNEIKSENLVFIQHVKGQSNHYRYYGVIKKMIPFWKQELQLAKNKKNKKLNSKQTELFKREGRQSGLQGEAKRPPGGRQSGLPNSSNNSIKNSNTHMATPTRTPLKKSLQKQLEINFTKPKQVVAHLREIASNGSEEKEAADISLRVIEQLWQWHQNKTKADEELLKSWKWLFYAAVTWPAIVNSAWGEIKDRKLQGEKMRKPGAILTLRIKELTNGNSENQNHA